MTRWLSLAVVVFALGVASSVFGRQDDAHIGTWKQNFDKSKATPAPTVLVLRAPKTMTYTFKGTNAQGEPVSGVQVFERQ